MGGVGIYIHIPFCRAKCLYCDFVSFPAKQNSPKLTAYSQALLQELTQCEELNNAQIETIFIGGGTPTTLPPAFLCEILRFLSGKNCAPQMEITIESNPESLDIHMLRALLYEGVNRLSFGLQAVQDNLLRKIGRKHSFHNFMEVYNSTIVVGFDNINVDLMYALPTQTLDNWNESLEVVSALKPQHISAYALTIEEPGPGALEPLGPEADRQMYYLCKQILKAKGYAHYEISNFAKEGYACRHNIKYWAREDYLGFGLSAHSFFNGRRYRNTNDLDKYIQECGKIKEDVFVLSEKDATEELIFLGLRMMQGIPEAALGCRYENTIQEMLQAKLLKRSNGMLMLTDKGIDISNIVMGAFL